MKRLITLFGFVLASCLTLLAQPQSEVKITTSKVYGDSFDMWPKTSSIDIPVIVDWGDGELKGYQIDPNSSGYFAKVSGKIVGDTIRIFSELTSLDCSEGGVTSLYLINQPQLTQLIASKNELTTDCYDFSGAPNLASVDVHANNLTLMDMREFTQLQFFTAYENPGLTTVLFPDGCETLQQISMSNCDISNFYPVSLPNLSSLTLSNNSLIEIELGEYYPNLSSLSVDNNYIQEINLSQSPKLTQLAISNNFLQELNISHNPALTGVHCSYNQLKTLDLSNNPDITRLSCANNQLTRLDVSKLPKLLTLTCDSNQLTRLDLSANSYLQKVYCKANQLEFLDFSGNNNLNYVDCRYNANMTACSVNYMFDTMWALWDTQYYANLLIEGCNAEGADASVITSAEYKWKTDITCDGSAVCDSVVITLQPAENGSYHLEQPTQYGQNYVEISQKAKVGTPIKVVTRPDEGYTLKEVHVNDRQIADSVICLNEAATIGVTFASTLVPYITLQVAENHEMSFALMSDNETTVEIDWGNGVPKTYTLKNSWTRIDEVSAGTQIRITGEVTAANFESYPGMGLWDNEITGIDVTHNDRLMWLSTYMNPIGTLDIRNCPELMYLDCAYCELTELDVTLAPGLSTLICYGNALQQLNITNNPELEELNAKNNQLTEIDLQNNSLLRKLDLQNNQLTKVQTSHMTNLESLALSGNQLTEIDLSKNTLLTELAVANNRLQKLDISQNTALTNLQCNQNQIRNLTLYTNEQIQYIDCEDNQMTACDLNDLYYSLPEFSSTEPVKGYNLRVKGMTAQANDADHAESIIAKGKGWQINYEGDGSGCDEAYITIKETEHGSVTVYDEELKEVKSGQKVRKNSPITIETTPESGYTTESVKANGETVINGQYVPTRATDIVVRFQLQSSISQTDSENVQICIDQSEVHINASSDSDIYIYDLTGKLIRKALQIRQTHITLTTGIYLIKVVQHDNTFTQKVILH